jgi:hypothetical protein
MPTRQLTGEGRANGEETDKHPFGSPGYWTRHARKVVWVIGEGPGLAEVAAPTLFLGAAVIPEVGEGHTTVDAE